MIKKLTKKELEKIAEYGNFILAIFTKTIYNYK